MYFVYRSPYEGPLSKRVSSLPDDTVLAWFQRHWTTGVDESAELGGPVYGLSSIFDAAAEHRLPVPSSTDELRKALHEHLYVEGDPEYCVLLDEHSLRARTDDDEVELAYYFLTGEVVARAPERLAYLIHEDWPLPDDAGPLTDFTSDVPVLSVEVPPGNENATTYAVLLTHWDGETLARMQPWAFLGVSLPNLAARIRMIDPSESHCDEVHVLRELVEPDDVSIAAVLERCNRWPGFNLAEDTWPGPPMGSQLTHGRQPELSRLQVSDHLAQLAIHTDDYFGYQQWFLFDNAWAARHPALAQSLLRYAAHWDPLEVSPVVR